MRCCVVYFMCVCVCVYEGVVCFAEGPEVCSTLETGGGQNRIPDPSYSPSSLTLCCHGMSPRVMVSLATGCFLHSEGDAGQGGREGGGQKVILGGTAT